MSQEFVYAAIARPTLRPSDLIYRRRVAKTSASEPSRAALSREENTDLKTALILNMNTRRMKISIRSKQRMILSITATTEDTE